MRIFSLFYLLRFLGVTATPSKPNRRGFYIQLTGLGPTGGGAAPAATRWARSLAWAQNYLAVGANWDVEPKEVAAARALGFAAVAGGVLGWDTTVLLSACHIHSNSANGIEVGAGGGFSALDRASPGPPSEAGSPGLEPAAVSYDLLGRPLLRRQLIRRCRGGWCRRLLVHGHIPGLAAWRRRL